MVAFLGILVSMFLFTDDRTSSLLPFIPIFTPRAFEIPSDLVFHDFHWAYAPASALRFDRWSIIEFDYSCQELQTKYARTSTPQQQPSLVPVFFFRGGAPEKPD